MTTAGLMHHRTHEKQTVINSWERFRFDVVGRKEALDQIIDLGECFLKSIVAGLTGESIDCWTSKPIGHYGFVDSVQILHHFGESVHFPIRRTFKSGREDYNVYCNLVRGLKAYRDNLLFLLPAQDQELTYDFLNRLGHPAF